MGENCSLTHKYRPLKFSDVLDQESIITVLRNLLLNKKFSSPLMFTGTYGGGKTTLARIFARASLCKNLIKTAEPCNECFSCKAFLKDSNPAYTEIDAASNSGVDDIRKLKENANFKVLGDYDRKVVVIDECHSISIKGNDALLKQLEDNNTDQIYIFCTTAPEKMHPTVRSRCLEFKLNKNSRKSISDRLSFICENERIAYDLIGLDLIASMTLPHVRDSLKALEYLSNFGKISEEVVFKHYKLILEDDYLNLIKNLKTNLLESLVILDNLISQEGISNIYEGIIRSLMNVLKLKNGINLFRTGEQVSLANYILEHYGEDLSKILEYLLNRNKYVDQLTLESDIIIINKKINSSFLKETSIEKVYIDAPVEKNYQKSISTEESNLSKEEKIDEVRKIEDLNETESILKRYPAYTPKLAMMMAKSKQKNRIVVDTKLVELKSKIKDSNQSLPREEIRDFIDKKINKR